MADPADFLWQVTQKGQSFGPYTTAMLQARVNCGRFSREALVWHKGLPAWQPIVLYFKYSDVGVSPQDRPIAEQDAPSPKPYLRWPISIMALAAFVIFVSGSTFAEGLAPGAFLGLHLGTIFVMLSAGAGTSVLWWRRFASWEGSPRVRGLSQVALIAGMVAICVAALVGLARTPAWYRLRVARQSFNHYTIGVNDDAGTLSIKGLIGPGLATKVKLQLDSNAAIRTIEIDSIGGLVADALKIASAIESRGNLTTKAVHNCNSACLLIFMAGDKRVAPHDLHFGFHATSEITRIEGAYDLAAMDDEGRQASAYLKRRGVPEEFIAQADAAGPSKLYEVSAIKMADVGAITYLTKDDAVIPLAKAKWQFILDAASRIKTNPALRILLSTLEEVDPGIPERFGPALWAASESKEPNALQIALSGMIGSLMPKAIGAADDGDLKKIVDVTSRELAYLAQKNEWKVCASFLDGKGFSGIAPPTNLAEEDIRRQAALFRSAARNDWIQKSVPSWASAYGGDLAKALALRFAREGIDLGKLDLDPRVSCLWTTALLAAFAEKPAPTTAGLYRWLLAGAK
jgi:hypothetical protein